MSEDHGEYAASLARFHRSTPNPHKISDATPILAPAPLPVLLRGSDEDIEKWAKEEEKEPEHKKGEGLEQWAKEEEKEHSEDSAANGPEDEMAERSQSAVAKDEDMIPDPENEVQDGPVAAFHAGASLGRKVASGGTEDGTMTKTVTEPQGGVSKTSTVKSPTVASSTMMSNQIKANDPFQRK